MDKEITAALIGAGAGILGGLFGAAAAWRAASSTNRIQQQIADGNLAFQRQLAQDMARTQRRAAIEAMILKLTELAIKYPTLEKDAYCAAYPSCPGDVNGKERYENYCVYVFNTLAAAFDFCEGDKAKIKEFVGAEELIRRHHRCWLADKDNLFHDEPFRTFVHCIIDDLKGKGAIT